MKRLLVAAPACRELPASPEAGTLIPVADPGKAQGASGLMTSPKGRESRPIRSTSGEMGWRSGEPEGERATKQSGRSWSGAIRSRRFRNGSESAPLTLCLEAEVREGGIGREREGCRDPAVERGLVQDAIPRQALPKLLFRRAAASQAVDACLAGPDRAQRPATATRKLPVRNGFVRSGPVHHLPPWRTERQ